MTKEEILHYKPSHKTFVNVVVPPNCAAGRCGHRTITRSVVGYIKEDVLSAMDVWAALKSKETAILFNKWCSLNSIEYSISDESYWSEQTTQWLSEEQVFDLYLDHLKQQSND